MTMMYIALLSLFILGITIASKHNDIMPFITGVFIGVAIMIGVIKHIETKSITPLDVYRGNTELEITSVNGIPTDTVVVFKNK
jgi:hypothetical protein